ncbi:hypothetical protein, partial [Nocardioides malaquae]|uniref:hypothetical protein n=1 Tax=Nocardioides malaquae TaxID=2773426 RepID=UPI001D0D139F
DVIKIFQIELSRNISQNYVLDQKSLFDHHLHGWPQLSIFHSGQKEHTIRPTDRSILVNALSYFALLHHSIPTKNTAVTAA